MRESLYDLLALQDVDKDIDELRRHKRDYPARIAELQERIRGIESARHARQERLGELDANYRHFKQQLQATKDDLDKHQERLQLIRTNKEYDAVQQEIVALQHANDEYEMEMLKADEEATGLRQQLADEDAANAEQIGTVETEIAEIERKMREIDEEVGKVMERRNVAAARLTPRMTTLYERVRRGKSLAVVRVLRGACGGCWRSLPPQRINELRMSHRVIVCEGCGRILVWDDRTESNTV